MFQRWSFSSKKTRGRWKIDVDENAKNRDSELCFWSSPKSGQRPWILVELAAGSARIKGWCSSQKLFFWIPSIFCDTSRNISFYCVSWGHAKHHFLSSEKSHNTISLLPVRKHPQKLAQSAIAFWAQNTNAPPLKTRFFTRLILGTFRNFLFITIIKCPLIYRDILKKYLQLKCSKGYRFLRKKRGQGAKSVWTKTQKTWH